MDARRTLLEAFPASVLTDAADMAPYLTDWFRDATGAALAVLRPRDVGEVRAMVRECARLRLGIVPQGGNTGLVAGALPQAHTQVCLSLAHLDRIRAIDPDDYSATVEAGCILQTVKDAVAAHDLFLPVTIGSQGSCRIGGLVSTNAGGINVLRWGTMREQILGLEIVLPDGSLWNGLSTLRKNNTGPDLKQLFIGAGAPSASSPPPPSAWCHGPPPPPARSSASPTSAPPWPPSTWPAAPAPTCSRPSSSSPPRRCRSPARPSPAPPPSPLPPAPTP
jgi:FAD/FMN-containing dehydrogenase